MIYAISNINFINALKVENIMKVAMKPLPLLHT